MSTEMKINWERNGIPNQRNLRVFSVSVDIIDLDLFGGEMIETFVTERGK